MIDFNQPADKLIESLKQKAIKLPSWETILKDYDPDQHRVQTDRAILRDKTRSDGTVEPATRISLAIEKLATSRMVDFMFAIPIKRNYSLSYDSPKLAVAIKAIEAIYKHARIDAVNHKRGTAYFASCESCTIWYAVLSPNKLYGFNSQYKLKCRTYSPMEGYRLYPLFDHGGDMLAMSVGYSVRDSKGETEYFETFTAERHLLYKRGKDGWELIQDEAVTIMKIPAVYMHRAKPIFADITGQRDELEYTLSRNGNVIAYNSAPILKVVGNLQGEERKGESRRIYRVEQGGDVGYVSWGQSIDALKYQVDSLVRFIFMQLQLPDLSFDAMSRLGNIGYDARQTLLADAHLKVGSEQYAIIEALEREYNIIREFLKLINVQLREVLDDLEVEHIITPFIQGDEKAEIEKRLLANGGKPLESQLESIQRYGYSDDAERTLKQLQDEANALFGEATIQDTTNQADSQ